MNGPSFSLVKPQDVAIYPLVSAHNQKGKALDPSQLKMNQKLYRIACLLFKIFGSYYEADISQMVGDKQYKILKDVANGFKAIRGKITKPIAEWDEGICKNLITTYWGVNDNRLKAAEEMAEESLCLLPFPQEALLMPPQYGDAASALTAERTRAFKMMIDIVDAPFSQKEERKEKVTEEKDKILLAKLLYSWAALPAKEREPIFFGELLAIWAEKNEARQQRMKQLFALAGVAQWATPQSDKGARFRRLAEGEVSFQAFFIQATLIALQEQLNSVLIELAKQKLTQTFHEEETRLKEQLNSALTEPAKQQLTQALQQLTRAFHDEAIRLEEQVNIVLTELAEQNLTQIFHDEGIRSDVLFFSQHPKFLNIVLSGSNRPSAQLLASIQGYVRIVKAYNLSPKDSPGDCARLFEWATFCNRGEPLDWSWMNSAPASRKSREDSSLTQALQLLNAFLNATKVQEQRFEYVFPLLHFCLKNQSAASNLVDLFTAFSEGGISFSAPQIYHFCKKNECFNFNDRDKFILIVRQYLKHIDGASLGKLILDPPLEISFEVLKALNGREMKVSETSALKIELMISSYTNFMSRFISPREDNFILWLRSYVLNPWPAMFTLFQDAEKWGVGEINQKFLSQFLPPSEFFQANNPELFQERAQRFISDLRKTYSLSLTELFTLYLEAVKFKKDESYNPWRKANRFIQELASFVPGLRGSEVFFLLVHYKPEAKEPLQKLRDLRREFVAMDRTRFFLNPQKMAEIDREIQNFCAVFTDPFSPEKTELFRTQFALLLKHSFTPPLQPLTDFTKIRNVTKEGGIEWRESHLGSHKGDILPVNGDGPVVTYFHWQQMENSLFLTLAVYNKKEQRGRWTVLPFPISVETLQDQDKKQRRMAAFSYFIQLADRVLNESTEFLHPSFWDKYQDNPDFWETAYPGIKEGRFKEAADAMRDANFSEAQIKAIFYFLCEIKVRYRNSYVSVLEPGEVRLSQELTPNKKVLEGFIEKGCLIPEDCLAIDSRELYSVEDPLDFIDRCAIIAVQPNKEPEPLGLEMCVTRDGMGVEKIPIYYQVQLVGEEVPTPPPKKRVEIPLVWHEEERKSYDPAPLSQPKQETMKRYLLTLFLSCEKDGSQESISIPVKYTGKIVASQEQFRSIFVFQLALLKGHFYDLFGREQTRSSAWGEPIKTLSH